MAGAAAYLSPRRDNRGGDDRATTRTWTGTGTATIATIGEASMTDSTDSPEDARTAAARERVLADARGARRVGD